MGENSIIGDYKFSKIRNESRFSFSKFVLFLGLIFLGTIILSGAVSAAGLAISPQPKFHHDNNNTGQSQYKGPQTNTTKWKYTTGGGIISSPTIGTDGTIYIGSFDKNLYALNPNGTQKWSFNSGDLIGFSPAIDNDGIIYFGCNKKIFALYPNGTEKWNHTLENGNIIGSSLAIGNDGTIYLGTFNFNIKYNNTLCALNPDGTEKWNFITGGIIELSTPAIGDDGTIYVGCEDNYLYAINPNGTEKWKFASNNMILSSPAIGSDGTIYFGSEDNNIYAINPNGTLKWKYQTNNMIDSSPAIGNDGTIYIESNDGFLYALTTNGNLKWKYSIYGGISSILISSPAIGNDGIVYVGSTNGCLYAINPNGTQKWNYTTTRSGIASSPAIGSDGTIYIGSEDNNLYALHDETIPPTVKTITPSNNFLNVPTNQVIKITFSEPIKSGSLWIELKNSSRKLIPITTLINNNILTINHEALLTNGKYTLSLHTGSITDLTGNHLALWSSSFTVDSIPPKVSSTTPTNLKTSVSRTSNIVLKYSENIKASIYYNNITIKNLTTGKYVTITKSISGNILYLKMNLIRIPYNWYQVTIPKAAIKDYAGNNLMATYTFKFRTGA